MKKYFILLMLFPVLAMAQVKTKPVVRTKKASSTRPSEGVNTVTPAAPALMESKPQGSIVSSGAMVEKVDIQPAFPGGRPAWISFLQNNLNAERISEADQQAYGLHQSVKVKFVVCEDGSLCNYEIVNKSEVSKGAADEALRVMRKSPNWMPGKYQNKKVKVRFIQPITFQFFE